MNDTVPVTVNTELAQIFNQKFPKQYRIAGISVSGTKSFDHNPVPMYFQKPSPNFGSKTSFQM
ncbi:MAG TPA: hypothetical protein PKA85_00585 [Ferruginibacter sp.]|nr:hypothetical protein [Ferruginibacter sp.]